MSAFTWPPESPTPASSRATASTGASSPEGEQIQAAVLVPLFLAEETGEPQVVLTKRRADLRRHAGEVSFPGGRQDPDDKALEDTALREAEEEIGLPRQQATLLGELPPTSTFATRYTIHPFVAQIPAGVAWRLSPKEVDTVLELPLAALRASATKAPIERRGITFETDAYVIADQVIWGATARILADLFDRLEPAVGDDGRLSLA